MEIGQRISKEEMARLAGVSLEMVNKRHYSARRIAQSEAGEGGGFVVKIDKGCFFRVPPKDIPGVATTYLKGARNKAKRARNAIRDGVMDWDALKISERSALYALDAQAAVMVSITSEKNTDRLIKEVSNGKIAVGDTIKLFAGEK